MRYREVNWFQRRLNVISEFLKRKDRWRFAWYRFQWNYFPQMNLVPYVPLHVDLEVADACNLRCVMCVHGIGEGIKNVGIIETNFGRQMVDQIAQMGVYSMKLNWRGEPALYQGLADLIRYAKEKGIPEVQMNTNGIPYNEDKIKDIIEAGMDRVIFSMDGNSKEVYEKIRVGSDFDRLVRNIESFIKIRNEMGRVKPFIRVQMVRTASNRHEVEGLLKRWQGRVDDVRINDVSNRGQGTHLTVGDQVSTGRRQCPQPWQRIIIARDGKVLPCCSDWHCQFPIGDAAKQTLKEIWKGRRMGQLRKLILDKKMDRFEPCKSCFVKESYTWKRIKVNGTTPAPQSEPENIFVGS